MTTGDAIVRTLESRALCNSNVENANVVDALGSLSERAGRIANSIAAPVGAGRDAVGGVVASLTEAVMGVTAGLVQIADAISDLADAVREVKKTSNGAEP